MYNNIDFTINHNTVSEYMMNKCMYSTFNSAYNSLYRNLTNTLLAIVWDVVAIPESFPIRNTLDIK